MTPAQTAAVMRLNELARLAVQLANVVRDDQRSFAEFRRLTREYGALVKPAAEAFVAFGREYLETRDGIEDLQS